MANHARYDTGLLDVAVFFYTMDEAAINGIIEQTLDGALATVPMYLKEVAENNEELKVGEPKEFVYGIVMGMALAMAGAVLGAQSGSMPTVQEQEKIRDMVYQKIPQIRAQIFQ